MRCNHATRRALKSMLESGLRQIRMYSHVQQPGKRMSWQSVVKELLAEGLRDLPNGKWPHSGSRFWHIRMDIDRATLRECVAGIQRDMHSGQVYAELPHVALLMFVLRTNLPGVQRSRLWPDVAAFFNDGSISALQTERCANFFRAGLRLLFNERLQGEAQEYRFVRLLLDEAGVGEGRARLITEFLTSLIDVSIGDSTDDAALSNIVRDAIARDRRDDVSALELVLFESGVALLRIQRALLTEVNPADLALWTWDDLSNFAQKIAGRQLSYLIPEAEKVFSALIPLLGKRITCARAYDLMSEPGITVNFPPSYSADSTPRSVDEIPFGLLRVRRGHKYVEITTVDDLGYSAKFLEGGPPNIWEIKSGRSYAAIWRRSPFRVKRKFAPSSAARLVCNDEGIVIGYFWSGPTWAGDGIVAICDRADHAEIFLRREPSIAPLPEWYLRAGHFDLHLSRIAYYDLAINGEVELVVNDRPIAKREIISPNGLFECSPPATFHKVGLGAGLLLTLRAGARILARSLVKLPRRPLLIEGNRVIPAGKLERTIFIKSQETTLMLIGDDVMGAPECRVGTLNPAGPIHKLPEGLTAFFWTVNTIHGLPWFRWDGFEWHGQATTSRLDIQGHRELEGDGYLVQGAGDIRPLFLSRPTGLELVVSSDTPDLAAYLLFRNGPIVVRSSVGKSSRIGVHTLLDKLQGAARERLTGLAVVSLQSGTAGASRSVGLYIAPESVTCPPVRAGLRASLNFSTPSGDSIQIASTRPADPDDPEAVAEIVFPNEGGLESGSSVRFLWIADVFDCRLLTSSTRGLSEASDATTIILTVPDLKTCQFELRGHEKRWSFSLQEGDGHHTMSVDAMQKEGGALAEIGRLWSENAICDSIIEPHIVAYYAGVTAGRWKLNLMPMLHSCRATILSNDDRITLEVAFDWSGLPPQGLGANIVSRGNIIESHFQAAEPESIFLVRRTSAFKMQIAAYMYASSSAEHKIELTVNRRPIGKLQLLPDIPLSNDEIPAALKGLLTAETFPEGVSHTCRQALALFYRYAEATKRVALNADRCASTIERKFGHGSDSGTTATCIRTLGMLLSEPGRVPRTRPPPSEEPSGFGIIVNEILARVLKIESVLGQLMPESVSCLRRAISRQLADDTVETEFLARINALASLCNDLARDQTCATI
jgi:hypothetical protein